MLLGLIAAARIVNGGRDHRVIAIVTSSMTFLSLYISRWSNVKYESIFHGY